MSLSPDVQPDLLGVPTRQIPQLRLQTEASTPGSDKDNSVDHDRLPSPLSPALDQSPFGKVLAKSTPKEIEFRKLLGLLLGNLRNRRKPPSIYDDFRSPSDRRDGTRVGVALNAIRGAVRLKRKEGQVSSSNYDSDSEEDDGDQLDYSTDEAVDWLSQLRDVLILSDKQGWNILSGPSITTQDEPTATTPKTPFRRRRPSLRALDLNQRGKIRSDDVVEECIDLLAELIADDCRFHIKSIRLSKPPNSLQSVCLDFAQCLLSNQRHNPKIQLEIGFAVVLAFSTFPTQMQPRLLKFFEECVISGMLENLSIIRGTKTIPNVMPSTPATSPPYGKLEPNPSLVSIRVDEPGEQNHSMPNGWLQWSPSPTPGKTTSNILSASAPGQALRLYQLAALVSPLLSVVLEYVEWDSLSTSVDTLYRLHRLLRLIVDVKPDAYLDLLEVIAYHSESTRGPAISILISFWPHAVGHAFVGRAFPIVSYQTDLAIRDLRTSNLPLDESAYSHQFVPWGFPTSKQSSSDGTSTPPYGIQPHGCAACADPIEGFGLLCTHCICPLHFACYDLPGAVFFSPHLSPDENGPNKVAIPRFSHVLPRRRTTRPPTTVKDGHGFRLVNLFTLMPCMACRLPLWGCAAQAMECSECLQFIHPKCVLVNDLPRCKRQTMSAPQHTQYTVGWEVMQQTFMAKYHDIAISEEELPKRTYEEISVAYGVLWVQLQILLRGVEHGTISFTGSVPTTSSHPNDIIRGSHIQRLVDLYERYLQSGKLAKSPTLEEYKQLSTPRSTIPPPEPHLSILFEWPLLVYITALIKSPRKTTPTPQQGGVPNFLTVNLNDDTTQTFGGEDSGPPFDFVLLSHMRDALGFELGIFHDPSARHLLEHLYHIGFFNRLDHHTDLFGAGTRPSETFCIFPLPLAIDMSTAVETLVKAIAVCLDDLDVAINEVGFLWLTKRCWPNGMASEYAQQRLLGLIISWMASEDDRLIRIARDYVARGKPLPGVRTEVDPAAWPAPNSNAGVRSSSRSGGDYISCRRELVNKYGARWMLALHTQDPDFYADAVYEEAVELSLEADYPETFDFSGDDISVENVDRRVEEADRVLRVISKVCMNDVIFSAFERVFARWMDDAACLGSIEQVVSFPALRRFANRESAAMRRASQSDPSNTVDSLMMTGIDPWTVVLNTAASGVEGISTASRWLNVLSRSSVNVPSSALAQIVGYMRSHGAPFSDYVVLADSLFCNAWVDPSGRHELIGMLSEIHTQYADWITGSHSYADYRPDVLRFLRFTFATCLLLYGCERRLVSALGLVPEAFTSSLVPSKPRTTSVIAPPTAVLGVDADIISASHRYVAIGDEEIGGLVAKFVCTLFTQPSLLATDAADRYLAKSGNPLYQSAWAFWDLQDDTLASLKANLLLRLLTTSTAPFEAILANTLAQELIAVDRLFKMILNLNDPSMLEEGSRSSVLPIFTAFFRSIWEDKSEEVRLSAEVLSRNLLPSHMTTISLCFDEAFRFATITSRLQIVAFLRQLLPHFPTWAVLSWKAIADAMDALDEPRGETEKYTQECRELHVALVSLSLQMLGSGIPVDLDGLTEIKYHLALVMGFSDAQLVEVTAGGVRFVRLGDIKSLSEDAYSCLPGLVRALDSATVCILPSMAMGIPETPEPPERLSVGAIFIDLFVALVGIVDFRTLPYLPARAILDVLIIVIYKYDMQAKALSHLTGQLATAVETTTLIVNMDVSYDLSSAAFTAALALLRRWPAVVVRILSRQIFIICTLLTELNLAKDNILVAQGTSFLEAAFTEFASNGLFVLLFKFDLKPEFFQAVKHVLSTHSKAAPGKGSTLNLKEAILDDTVKRLTERADNDLNRILPNLKEFVEKIYHQEYDPKLIHSITVTTNTLARLAMDYHSVPFNPNPWLEMCILVIRHNKAVSRDLLVATEVFLKAVMNRFELTPECLDEVLVHAAAFYRREETAKDLGLHIGAMVVDALSDALRGRTRPPPNTMIAMLTSIKQVLRISQDNLPPDTLKRIAVDSSFHLCTPFGADIFVESHFTATTLAADMVLEATKGETGFLNVHFASRVGKFRPSVRAWNALVLSALSDPSPLSANALFINLKNFALLYGVSLQPLTAPGAQGLPETIALDLNQAFTAVKLWMMLCRQKHRSGLVSHHDADVVLNRGVAINSDESEVLMKERTVWNELWPPFENVLAATSVDESPEEVTPLALAIWSSFADLVIFVHQIRSPIALESSVVHISTLKRLIKRAKSESANAKFNRALKCVLEPPIDLPLDVMVAQARTELLAAEKLAFAVERRKMGPVERRPDRRREFRTAG